MVTTFTATSKWVLLMYLVNFVYLYISVYSLLFKKKECNSKKYGLECNQTCGNCSNGEECHHVGGRCLNGCDVGVFGDKCDQGKMFK